MLRTKCLLPDRQGALIERLGLCVMALISVEASETVEARG